jgi:DNA-binding NarL/FixJ family response regulator
MKNIRKSGEDNTVSNFPVRCGGGVLVGPRKMLSKRREEVWRGIALSETTKGIALSLGVSAKTVEYHRNELYYDLQVFDVAGLTRLAVRIGLIEA